jgi:hypothetical protein
MILTPALAFPMIEEPVRGSCEKLPCATLRSSELGPYEVGGWAWRCGGRGVGRGDG